MEIDKMYMIPTRRRSTSPKEEERRRGLCHLCKGQGHIQHFCPRKSPEPPAHAASAKITPLVPDQGVKRPQSLTMNPDDVLCYLKRTTLANQNEIVAALTQPAVRQDFFPHLSKLAFAQAIKSNVFLPKLNTMRIPITLHTAQKKADHIAFLDCGATKCFISQRYIDEHRLGVHLMENPQKLQNADGSPNAGGGLKYFTKLKVITRETPHLLHFYIADIGPDDLVLGYPWFTATNTHPNWTTGTLPASIIIRTKGVASGKPMRSVWVAGMRTTIQN